MQPLAKFNAFNVRCLFTDIDDTMTDQGKLGPEAYESLWRMNANGIAVVPVTGRPAGWCEMIARAWPVHGVIGENGGFYFRYHDRKMQREFAVDELTRIENQSKLKSIRDQILIEVPGAAVASDQFCRMMDLAIDFAEDVDRLSDSEVDAIVAIFKQSGAQAKISSIHVNGWFGDYDKLSMCRRYVQAEFNDDLTKSNSNYAFSGDSPNDEPMFGFFKNSFAVANIDKFLARLQTPPAFVATREGGNGFVEIANLLIARRL